MSDTIAEPRPEAGEPVLPAREVERPPSATSQPAGSGSTADQLARLEDKTARIEEKLSRSESSTQRVVDRFEAASHRMSEVAQSSELAALRGDVKYVAKRVRSLPGFGALVVTAVITAVLAAALTILVLRYMPGLTVR